jgi:streptogramin lyase
MFCSQARAQQPARLRLPNYPHQNVAAGYEVVPNWPARPPDHDHAWHEVSGVAIDEQGLVWIAQRGIVPIQVFSQDGKLVQSWGKGEYEKPHQIRFDPEGSVWVVDAGLHVVDQRTREGKLIRRLGVAGVPGDDSAHFDQPTDIAFLPNGALAITDGYGNNRVMLFNRDGRFLKSWGKLGTAPGEFSLPHSIVADAQGLLYVADRNNARIQVFDASGQLVDVWASIMVPWTLWLTPDQTLLACGSSPMRWPKLALPGMVLGVPPKDQIVVRFNRGGRVLEQWSFPMPQPGAPTKPGTLSWVHGIAADQRGNLFLGEIQGRRLQKFTRLDPETTQADILVKQPPRDPGVRTTGATESAKP